MIDTGVLPKLAVVPFKFEGIKTSPLEVVGEILADNVITLLSRSLHIKVISRLSTTKFRNSDWSFASIKSKLNCDFILFGSYVENNNVLEIVFHLTSITNGIDIWADVIHCSVRDILTIDSPLVENLAKTTAKAIFDSSVSTPIPESLGQLETHALYINGLNLMHSEKADEFILSRNCFMQIIERQPIHSTVHALLSLSHLLQTQRDGGWALRDQKGSASIIRYYIEKSLELNPGNEYALALKGSIEVYLDKNIELGIDLTRQALTTNQNDPKIYCCSSMALMAARNYEEAVLAIEKAIELSPLDPQLEFFYALAAATYYHTGQYKQAERYAQRSIEINPSHTSPLRTIIATQMAIHEPALAKISAQRLLDIEPGFTVDGWLKHWCGDPVDGHRLAEYLAAAGIPQR